MGAMIFLFPAVLFAAGLAAAPVIIHLIMRTKPRRMVFPALRFVKKTHQANISKLRLKHLLLLLMRMAAIGLVAFLLARWQIPSWKAVAKNSAPVAAVVIIDNSASMTARQAGQTLLSKAKTMAGQLVEQLPQGSKIALLDTASSYGGEFLVDRKLIQQQASDVPVSYDSRSLAASLAKATAMLAGSDMGAKELYVITDMTGQAWRDVPGQKGLQGIQTVVLDCGLGEDTNIALGEIKLASTIAPVGVPVPMEVTITGAIGGDVNVLTELDGKPVDQRTVRLTPGVPLALELAVRPEREGVLQGRVVLQYNDALEMDNVRYFTLEARPLPEMLLATDRTTDMTYFMMLNAISPGAGRTWVRCDTITAQTVTADRLDKMRVVLLADMPSLSDAEWRALAKYVNEGGQLWIVTGPLMSVQAYNTNVAQQIMPVVLKSLEEMPAGVAWRGGKGDEPMLAPFRGGDNGSLADVLCKMRFQIQSVASDAQVVLKYADDVPAIVRRPFGEGSVLLWNFTPDPQYFSPTGLTQFAVLTQHTVRQMVGDQGAATAFYFGKEAELPLPKSMKSPVITVRRPDSQAEDPVLPDYRRGVLAVRADKLGQWLVRMNEGQQKIEKGFSVNAEPSESRLTPADAAKVTELFEPDTMRIMKEVQQIEQQRQLTSQPMDMAVPVLLALLALMMGEAFFANRFYKQASAEQPGASPGE